jgi:isopentenyl diphosphate isomerase/L-lactate dehydrogenase-like FMN-dependent dehydrogenase
VLDGARRPAWWWAFLRSDELIFANVASHAPGGTGGRDVAAYLNSQFDPAVTWERAEAIRQQWGRTLAIKGVQCADDARRAVDIGAQIIIVSNHGGRQLDQARPTLHVLPEVVEAVADRAEVVLDGGIRRGTDVVKALALGAQAVMIGRAYLYGLAAGGEAGVDRALALLRAEVASAMSLLGTTTIKSIDGQAVQPRI